MGWISFQASEESQSLLTIGSDLSHTVKSTPIVKEYSSIEWLTGDCQYRPFGTMLKPFHQGIFLLNSSISFTEAFHARTSVLQDMERAWQESEADYFGRSCAFPKKSSPRSYSLKMSQLSLPGVGSQSLDRLPKWGMIVDGVLYPLQALERYTVAKDGFFWATPNTMDHLNPRYGEAMEKNLFRGDHANPKARRRKRSGNLREQVVHPQMWPQNLWPTPGATEGGPIPPDTNYRQNQRSYNSRTGKHVQITLRRAVQMYPTPTRRNAPDCPCERRRDTPQLECVVNMEASTNGKKLSPEFVELLMGYPKEWTVLGGLGMQWFRSKRKKRSKS